MDEILKAIAAALAREQGEPADDAMETGTGVRANIMRQLRLRVNERFTDKPGPQDVLAKASAHPDSLGWIALLAEVLDRACKADPVFAAELLDLWERAEAAAPAPIWSEQAGSNAGVPKTGSTGGIAVLAGDDVDMADDENTDSGHENEHDNGTIIYRRNEIIVNLGSFEAPGQHERVDVDVSVYLDVEEAADPVESVLVTVLRKYGFQVHSWGEPIRSSWFRRMRVSINKARQHELTRRLAGDLSRAVELRAVDQAQAQVDAAQGDVVAKLLTALASTSAAAIQIGSVLLIKVDGVPMVRNLTQLELAHLQRNPDLVRDPAACLSALQHAADQAARTAEPPEQDGKSALPSG
ncbi:hypothetical protein [Kutzneria buriramensis]|uniref:Uncharacterized protein n=1 Tax=Kutzneria buriramensis TaxID=1045776 RepID=A0A3E0GWE9_9PSEU|nr:hypothetical protein [Kutzneria buriramensis]REH31005.1 hypothetical protein BCF44_12228 [Kutzneria buriramensis]